MREPKSAPTENYEVGDLIVIPDGDGVAIADVLAKSPTRARLDGREVLVPECTGYVIRLEELDRRSIRPLAGRRFPSVADARAFLLPFQAPPKRRRPGAR